MTKEELQDTVDELTLKVEALTKERDELKVRLVEPKIEPEELVRMRKREHQLILRGGK